MPNDTNPTYQGMVKVNNVTSKETQDRITRYPICM